MIQNTNIFAAAADAADKSHRMKCAISNVLKLQTNFSKDTRIFFLVRVVVVVSPIEKRLLGM